MSTSGENKPNKYVCVRKLNPCSTLLYAYSNGLTSTFRFQGVLVSGYRIPRSTRLSDLGGEFAILCYNLADYLTLREPASLPAPGPLVHPNRTEAEQLHTTKADWYSENKK